VIASTALQEALLALKIAFLVLLYLFIWRIVRTVGRDTRPSQESFVLRPAPQPPGAQSAGAQAAQPQAPRAPRLVVASSPVLPAGGELELDSTSFTVGRSDENDVSIDGDEFASARHARIEPRRDGVWVHDLGSTNGTFVNGEEIDGPRRLANGDVVSVGSTDLRFEE
jgi:pSer/pThr/pTyr-binding forkhead associated (FHA) protein